MKVVRVALWGLVLVLVAIGIAIASLPFYLEAHKALLAEGASRALGRSVKVEGAGQRASQGFPAGPSPSGCRLTTPAWKPRAARAHPSTSR